MVPTRNPDTAAPAGSPPRLSMRSVTGGSLGSDRYRRGSVGPATGDGRLATE
jgi:hypothetical protein